MVKRLYCPWRDWSRLMAEWRRELEEARPDVSGWSQGELLEWIGQPEDIAQELQAALEHCHTILGPEDDLGACADDRKHFAPFFHTFYRLSRRDLLY